MPRFSYVDKKLRKTYFRLESKKFLIQEKTLNSGVINVN